MLLTKLANQEVVNFLKTLTIKNGYFAEQLKKVLVNQYYQDLIPEERNPYYMHLMGQYILKTAPDPIWISDPSTGIKYRKTFSSSFTMTKTDGTTYTVKNATVYDEGAFDEMMYVTSLDTQETIPFTRELLHGDAANAASAVHKKTLEAYKVSGRYFDILCKKYPKQVDLIKSIVYLVPPKELSADEIASYNGAVPSDDTLRFQRITEAEHLEVLNCDTSILEERERENILSTIKAFLAYFKRRWDVSEYTYEDNYANVSWSLIWSILPLLVITQRYANIKGPHAHSSHIWDYLESNGLASYRGYLTEDQELFLYKNIKFLKDNSGQNRILNILIDNLLSEYNLHIESKTIVLDKTDVLKDTTQTSYSSQCSTCSRKSICFKGITQYKCSDYVGISDLFKPEPRVLTEEIPGARKDKIISLLISRYNCTSEEAEKRYDRSFIWKDEAIETIKAELDREQAISIEGTIEELSDVIYRENSSGLEPEYSDEVVEEQRKELRHVRSTYLPTKLLEITEDPVEPRMEELFTKFITDSILHLAPYAVNGKITERISDTYTITVGEDAMSLVLDFGELVAALYLGCIKEYKPDIALEIKTGTNSVNGRAIFERQLASNFLENDTFDFRIPTAARIGCTFKFGMPVKQQALIEAWENADESLEALGNYVQSTDTTPQDTVKYYTLDDDTGEYSLEGTTGYVTSFVSGTTNYVFKTLPELITNSSLATEEDIVLSKIDDEIYAITRKAKTDSVDDAIWASFDKNYVILGKFTYSSGTYFYHENNNEIGIIPRYFVWHSDHLGVKTFATTSEMTAYKYASLGDYCAVYDSAKFYQYTSSGWTQLGASTTIAQQKILLVYDEANSKYKSYRDPLMTKSADAIYVTSAFDQNMIHDDGSDYDTYADKDTGATEDDSGNLTTELKTYASFRKFFDSAKVATYEQCTLDHYINVDWILENLYVDMMKTVTEKEDLGEYFEKMFTILERLEIIRASAGDIKTKLAVSAFLKAVMIPRQNTGFKLITVEGNNYPTYSEWFSYNSEIGETIQKLDSSADKSNLWDEFNTKLFDALLTGCDLVYGNSGTDKTKYNKLKELVKSLSSYLINFIDTSNSDRVSTELPHLAFDTPAHVIDFTSHMHFDVIGNNDSGVPQIPDVNSDLYLPALERFAKKDVQYYLRVVDPTTDEFTFEELTTNEGDELHSLLDKDWRFKGFLDSESDLPTTGMSVGDVYHVYEGGFNYVYTEKDFSKAWVKSGSTTVYFKVNIAEELGCTDGKTIQVFHVSEDDDSFTKGWWYTMDGETKQSDKLTAYMQLATMSNHIDTESNWSTSTNNYITSVNKEGVVEYPSQL